MAYSTNNLIGEENVNDKVMKNIEWIDLVNLDVEISSNYNSGEDAVVKAVRTWLKSRGIKEDSRVISEEEYQNLKESDAVLTALENAGVDNWDGYGYAMEAFIEEEEDD